MSAQDSIMPTHSPAMAEPPQAEMTAAVEPALPLISIEVARSLFAYGPSSPYYASFAKGGEMSQCLPSINQSAPAVVRASRAEVAAAMAKHSRVLLQFSGGKDSLACLYLLRPYWDRLTVMWSSRGDPFPEVVELLAQIRPLVREVVEVSGNAKAHIEKGIYPVDLVPVPGTWLGRTLEPATAPFIFASRYDCCTENFWKPMAHATEAGGFDLVVRGQRDSEAKRAPFSSGAVDSGGRTYLLPLQHWSKQDVLAYLHAEGVELPRQYAYGLSSLDCLHCTAYLEENGGKRRYLRDFHPEAAIEYERRLRLIQGAQEREHRLMRIALGEIEPAEGEGMGD
ncbi:phosphoadenosine phosphosulfate reductase family protein [Cupriavidus basilensis]|uniref:phosphoadenosine phosphosulfate reductase domain-containing protein n=1 Tax=Cupriavidus basilensis TaxID=68895 RepID=UPI0039F65CB5